LKRGKNGIKGLKIKLDQNAQPWWRVEIDSKKPMDMITPPRKVLNASPYYK
jgi:hypothetical protein